VEIDVVLVDRKRLKEHLPWIIFALIVLGAATGWLILTRLGSADWPGGSSWPGFVFGIVGGLIILFEFLLWPRKLKRTWRVLPVRTWMRAHIWLGLLCFPLLIYHSGFLLGGPLSTVLMILLTIVIASGIWGLVLQQVLPRYMFEQLPAETIYSQIDSIASQLSREAERLVLATCGPLPGEKMPSREIKEMVDAAGVGYLTVGAVRSAGRVQGKVLQTRVPSQPVPEAEPLRQFFRGVVEPYLTNGAKSSSMLRSSKRASVLFQDVCGRLPAAAHEAAHTLESLCEQRRQLDVQRRLHFWLHSWLSIHLPLSVALVVLMFVHVFVALKYW